MKRLAFVSAAVAALSVAGFALAQQGPGPGMGPGSGMGGGIMMQYMDQNGDGQITREEMQAFHMERFGMMDRDGNGRVTEDEFVNRPAGMQGGRGGMMQDRMRGSHFRAFDGNGDGVLDESEWGAMQSRAAMMDRNSDGMISPDEMPRMAPRGRMGGGGMGGRGGSRY